MAEEIQEAIQIIRVAYDGVEICMKAGCSGLKALQQIVQLFKYLLDQEKLSGKTSMKKLLMRGGDLQVLKFPEQDLKRIEKAAKKYGILYTRLPDINAKDGYAEILFHSEAVPRVNLLIEKLKSGKIATIEDYLNNGVEEEMEKLPGFLKERLPGGNYREEELEELQELAARIQANAIRKDTPCVAITLDQSLIAEETADRIKTRIPGTWGEHIRYLWIDKADMVKIHGGKTMLTFLDPEKDYTIFGKEEKLREQIRGAELYEKHYDPVEKELRKKAETTEKQQTKNERAKNERTKNRKKSGETGAKNSRKTGRKKGR